MKFMKLTILALLLPMVVQAAQVESKRKAAQEQQQSKNCGCIFICGSSSTAKVVPIVLSKEEEKRQHVREYFQAHPQAMVHHIQTGSEEMRKARVDMLRKPINSPSAKKEQDGARLMQQEAAHSVAEDLKIEQEANTKFWKPKPRSIPEDQIIQVAVMGTKEKQRRRHRKETLATQQKEKQEKVGQQENVKKLSHTDSMELDPSPRPVLPKPKQSLHFKFDDGVKLGARGRIQTIVSKESAGLVPLPSEEFRLGDFAPVTVTIVDAVSLPGTVESA